LNGHTDTVELLLGHGATLHICNEEILRISITKKYTDITGLLLKYGANTQVLTPSQLHYIKDFIPKLLNIDI
jgi:hypothetical protein